MLPFSDMAIRKFEWWLTALGHGLLLRVFSELSSFQESTVGNIQPLVSFRFVSCILVDWSFHLPIWATGFQERKMLAVITGHFKRSSSSWIAYFSSWGTLPALVWASFAFIVCSYLSPFSLMNHSSKMASLHSWLGQLAKRSPCFQGLGFFLNKIFQEFRLCLQKIKIHSIRFIFFLRQLIQLCKILDRFNQSFHRDWFYLGVDRWSPVLSVIFFSPKYHSLTVSLVLVWDYLYFPYCLGIFRRPLLLIRKLNSVFLISLHIFFSYLLCLK